MATPPVAKPSVPIAKPVSPAQTVPIAAPFVPAAPAQPPPAQDEGFILGNSEPSPQAPVGVSLFASEEDGTLVRPRHYRKKKWGWKKYTLLTVTLLVLGSLGATAYLNYSTLKAYLPDPAPSIPLEIFPVLVRNLKSADEKAFKISVPQHTWEHDKEIRLGLAAHVALHHREQDIWVAATAKDYGTQKPRDAELLNEAIDRLKQFYSDSLELDDKAVPVTLAGQSGQRLRFKGQFKTVPHYGECYMIAHHGFGYWFFIGAPTFPEAQKALEDFQAGGLGFTFVTERRGWREQPPKMDTFTGVKYPYALSAPQGAWDKFLALDEDEAADLFLLGQHRKENENRKNASILTMILPKQENLKEAMKFTRNYVEEKRKEENKSYKLVASLQEEESEPGQKAEIGNRPGRIAELRVLLGDEAKRYMVLAVINEADNLFAIRCECPWESRQIWRQEFFDVIATVKLRKKDE
jgi:hypothetical protein